MKTHQYRVQKFGGVWGIVCETTGRIVRMYGAYNPAALWARHLSMGHRFPPVRRIRSSTRPEILDEPHAGHARDAMAAHAQRLLSGPNCVK